jgi:hypothetical protein
VENKTFEKVWGRFSRTNSDDEERFCRKSNKNRLRMVKAVTVFFVPASQTGVQSCIVF